MFACGVMLLLLGFAGEAKATIRVAGTYTNVEYHEETGDLLGVEIRIVPGRGRGHQGTLQWCQGGPLELRLVKIVVDADQIRLEDPTDPAHTIFEGILSADGLRGRFVEQKDEPEELFLRREPGYWEKLGMRNPEY